VTGTKRGAPRESPEEVTDEKLERIRKLAEHGQGTRDYSSYVRERLGMVPSLRKIQWPDADE
jgi:hypothetical protein